MSLALEKMYTIQAQFSWIKMDQQCNFFSSPNDAGFIPINRYTHGLRQVEGIMSQAQLKGHIPTGDNSCPFLGLSPAAQVEMPAQLAR